MLEEVNFFHVDPSGNVKKTSSKINFRGWPHLSVFRVDLILSTRNLIHVRYILIRLLFLLRGFGPLFSLFWNLQGLVQPYRSAKFAKTFGQVPHAKFAKYFEMARPRRCQNFADGVIREI